MPKITLVQETKMFQELDEVFILLKCDLHLTFGKSKEVSKFRI